MVDEPPPSPPPLADLLDAIDIQQPSPPSSPELDVEANEIIQSSPSPPLSDASSEDRFLSDDSGTESIRDSVKNEFHCIGSEYLCQQNALNLYAFCMITTYFARGTAPHFPKYCLACYVRHHQRSRSVNTYRIHHCGYILLMNELLCSTCGVYLFLVVLRGLCPDCNTNNIEEDD